MLFIWNFVKLVEYAVFIDMKLLFFLEQFLHWQFFKEFLSWKGLWIKVSWNFVKLDECAVLAFSLGTTNLIFLLVLTACFPLASTSFHFKLSKYNFSLLTAIFQDDKGLCRVLCSYSGESSVTLGFSFVKRISNRRQATNLLSLSHLKILFSVQFGFPDERNANEIFCLK